MFPDYIPSLGRKRRGFADPPPDRSVQTQCVVVPTTASPHQPQLSCRPHPHYFVPTNDRINCSGSPHNAGSDGRYSGPSKHDFQWFGAEAKNFHAGPRRSKSNNHNRQCQTVP